MDNNNWRPNQSTQSNGAGEPAVMDTGGDWRAQLHSDSRQRIVNKIMETLKRHLPFSGQEGLQELRKIAVRFEDKIYSAATSQSDYLRKISMKMLTMETKSQHNLPNPLPTTSNPASNSMQAQVPNQGQSLPISIPANQTPQRQQMPSQNIQNNMASAGAQSSVGLVSAQLPVSGLAQTPILNVSGQNTVGMSMSQGPSSNVFSNSQGQQMQGRQQVVAQPQQQHSQNSQQYLYQQQLQQQILKQKLQQGNIPQSVMQSHLQRQQQNLLQPTQLQSSQQSAIQSSSVMQPSMMQSNPVSGLQQNQQSSLQQSSQPMIQHQQSVHRQQQQQQQQPQQAAVITQQQTSMSQQPTLAAQQQQQPLMGQPPSAGNMQQNQLIGQQNQLIGQQNNVGDMQQQQQQRFLGQQNNLSDMQQHQMMAQSRHQQQLSSQNNVYGLSHQQQQQQSLGSQPSNSGMQTGQQSVNLLQQSKVQGQPQTQSAASLLPTQGQHSQQLQQQLMSNSQSQPSQMQQQPSTLQQQPSTFQQQPSTLQHNMHQRLQTGLLQQQTAADQQKQIFMSQRVLPETSSTSMDSTAETGQTVGGDWQEEIYQKIKAMKEMYFPDLNEMYQRIAFKLQQHESLQQPPKSEQVDKLKAFEAMLKRMMVFLQLSKSNVTISYKEKLGAYEKQIENLINAHRPGRRLPQGQFTATQMVQQSQSQNAQVQSQENQMNPQLQPMNIRGPVSAMQQNMASLQQNSISTMPTQQNMVTSLQPNSNLDSGQAHSLNSLQQVAMGSLQQNPVSSQPSTNLSSQSGVNVPQSNITSVHSNSNMLQLQHLKQQEQHLLQTQTQQLKHIQQRQMQQQLQKQQILQQQQIHQQPKQQLSAQLQPHQFSQMNQMNEINDMKIRNFKPGVFQSVGQRTAYQQLKPGTFPISSPQLQNASPQIPQHSSPQVDQQNLLTSITKASTPLQSTTPPFVAPSPSTSVAPSPMPGESEKPVSAVSTQLLAGNIGHQQPTTAGAPAQSLAIGTPGISASPLLAEFSNPDGTHANALINVSGKSSVTEQPIERLIKAVKSMSPAALEASVSDIGAAVSMMDRVAGAAPGNGSRAAVGEDLVAMTKCRLQARNYMTHDGSANKKMRRYTSAMPLNIASSVGSANDSLKQLATSELESTATSIVKRTRSEANHALLEEIRQINQRLIDTVVDVSNEDVDPTTVEAASEGGEGTIVKCSYCAVALSPSLKAQYASAQLSPIQPLRLLVPLNYPKCSPVLLDKIPVEVSKEYEDLSAKAKSRFSISLRSLSQPMSLGEIARTWDNCARAVITEYAQQSGGGSFSSKYGTWEDCLSAA